MAAWQARGLVWLGRKVAALSPQARARLARGLLRLPWVNARRRRIASINLALCFPQLGAAARRDLLQRTLRSNATGALETLCAWFASRAQLAGGAHITGMEHLHAALAEGRGAVVVGAHYDGIELAMRHVADAAGQPMPILVRRHNDAAIEAAIAAYRLWEAAATAGMPPFDPPEIHENDLMPVVLDCASWGIVDPRQLGWLDPPSPRPSLRAQGRRARRSELGRGLCRDQGSERRRVGRRDRR